MRRGLKPPAGYWEDPSVVAARAAPYEKGTETFVVSCISAILILPRARPPMRRGLKHGIKYGVTGIVLGAARAAPYEKGTETE